MFTMSVAILVVAAPVPRQDPAAEPTDAAKAREKAVGWLSKQARDGQWPVGPAARLNDKMSAGVDALATAALLEAGVLPAAAPVDAALVRLAADKTEFTYTVALRTVALAKADPKKYSADIQRNADWLAKTAVRADGQLAGWSYPLGQEGKRADGSNTQYAVMALSVAADAGAKVDPKLWQEVRGLYVRTRNPGGWVYTDGAAGKPTQTMTAAALCGLYLSDKHLGRADDASTAARTAGLADWAKRYGVMDGMSEFYQWHGTARLGRLMGKPAIPGPGGREVNWYREGLDWLVKHQNEDGSWGRPGLRMEAVDNDGVIATSFGLLFLGPPKR